VLIYDPKYNENPLNDIHIINENLNTDISKKNMKNKNNIENNNLNFEKSEKKTEKHFLKISIDDPLKFQKLMIKEQELWNLAEIKNEKILHVWSELNKGGDCIEKSIYKSFQDMKNDLSSGVPVEYILGKYENVFLIDFILYLCRSSWFGLVWREIYNPLPCCNLY
jgi:hypothetical protein